MDQLSLLLRGVAPFLGSVISIQLWIYPWNGTGVAQWKYKEKLVSGNIRISLSKLLQHYLIYFAKQLLILPLR